MATDKKIPSNLIFNKEKFRYNTIQDVINDTGLTVGLVVETDGYNTLGDGFDAKYLITNVNEQGSILLKNGNYAKEISNSNGSKKLDKVNTIEELKSQNLKVGDIVEVLGYYEAGDGAGHKRIIADTDDGSGVELRSGKWANIVHNGEVNVLWLGCDKKGIRDNSIIINNFIEIIRKNISENTPFYYYVNTLYFPTGKYLFEDVINLTSFLDYAPFTIKGEGAYLGTHSEKSTGTIFYGETGREVFDLSGSKFIRLKDFSISDKPLASCKNPSNIGIVLARAKDNGSGLISPVFCQDNNFENIIIKFNTRQDNVNKGYGSIGIYNYASEVNRYNNIKIISDTCIFMSCSNEINFSSIYLETFINPKTDQYTMSLNNFDNVSLCCYKNSIIAEDLIDSSFSNFGIFNWGTDWGRGIIFRGSKNERITFKNFHCEEIDNAITLQSAAISILTLKDFNVVNNSKPIIEGFGQCVLDSCDLNIGCLNKNYWDNTGYKANGTLIKMSGELKRVNFNIITSSTWFENMFDTKNCRILSSSLNYSKPYDAITGLKSTDELSIKCFNKSFESLNTNELYKRISYKNGEDIVEAWLYKSGKNIEIKGCIKFKKNSNYYNKNLGVVLTEYKPSLGYSTINSSSDNRILEIKIQPSGEVIIEDFEKNNFDDNQICVCDINVEYDIS